MDTRILEVIDMTAKMTAQYTADNIMKEFGFKEVLLSQREVCKKLGISHYLFTTRYVNTGKIIGEKLKEGKNATLFYRLSDVIKLKSNYMLKEESNYANRG